MKKTKLKLSETKLKLFSKTDIKIKANLKY